MHELSLVQSIFSTLEAELMLEELAKVTAVELKIGKLANVEPILLQNAFQAYQETNPQYAQVELKTEMVEIKVFCDVCQLEREVENYVFICSKCGKPTNKVVAGEELLIQRIYFQE